MFKSVSEFDSAMKTILIAIRDEQNIDEILSSEDYRSAIHECCMSGFVEGVNCFTSEGGTTLVKLFNPRITKSGLAFIESH